jgi:uncharacterized protein HemY
MNPDFQRRLQEADRLLRQRQPQAAEAICAALLNEAPGHREALLITSRARQMRNEWDGMLAHVDRVLKAEPGDMAAQLMRVEALSALGEIVEAQPGRMRGCWAGSPKWRRNWAIMPLPVKRWRKRAFWHQMTRQFYIILRQPKLQSGKWIPQNHCSTS